jgi:hypothetical protein
VPALADCLEERAPRRYTVVDRLQDGETLASAQRKYVGADAGGEPPDPAEAAALGEVHPALVVVGLGGRELAAEAFDVKALRGALGGFVTGLRPKGRKPEATVLLLSAVPPTLAQVEGADPALQEKLDRRAADWNGALADLARPGAGLVHVDLLRDWPKDPTSRAALTVNGWSLSDQGHARVAAAVCDAVLALPAEVPPSPTP